MSTRMLTRRAVLQGAGIGTAALVVGPLRAAVAKPHGPQIFGVGRIGPPTRSAA